MRPDLRVAGFFGAAARRAFFVKPSCLAVPDPACRHAIAGHETRRGAAVSTTRPNLRVAGFSGFWASSVSECRNHFLFLDPMRLGKGRKLSAFARMKFRFRINRLINACFRPAPRSGKSRACPARTYSRPCTGSTWPPSRARRHTPRIPPSSSPRSLPAPGGPAWSV